MNDEFETVRKIISAEFSEKSLKITPVVGRGSVNHIYVVETENSKLVVRMNEPGSLDEYEKEVWCSRSAREKNIPTPEILKTGVFNERAYSVQEFVEGLEGREAQVERKFIWERLGEYASRIHTIEVAGFSLKLCDLVEGNSKRSWLEHVDYNIESLNSRDRLLELGVLTKEQAAKTGEIFQGLRSLDFKFGLNHGDLSLRNTILDRAGAVHLLDWGSAEAHIVPHHELIELLKMKMLENDPEDSDFRAFLEGYGISAEEYQKMLPALEGLLLLRALDKLRWAIDREIANLQDYIFDAKETVRNFLR